MVEQKSGIVVRKTGKSRIADLDPKNVGFGKHFSDHMFVADYIDGHWTERNILPYDKILFSPAASMMHYGQAIFEGMKAYKNEKGQCFLFRPLENFKRINVSAERMAMPRIPEEVFMDGLIELLKLDQQWIPSATGSSLYIRPLYIATDEYIGVKPSDSYKFIILTSPVTTYYTEPVKVLVELKYIRAVEGGVGYVKASGNYGRSLYPAKLAQQKGYHQIVWTDAQHHRYVEESGTMNLMFVIDGVLVTPPLGDTILAGITRDSVLTLARDWGMKVEERKISIDELVEAHKKGILQEAFGTGTAATIAHICLFGFQDKQYTLPALTDNSFSVKVAKTLDDIRHCRVPDKFNWMYEIK